MKPREQARFWQIDALRGVAVIMMIVFHFLFDLWYFKGLSIAVNEGVWLVLARATLIMFLLLAGISLSISHSRRSSAHFLRRGLKIFGYGLAITAVTFVAFPQNAIWFGVLHCIGLSIILAIPAMPKRNIALMAGVIIILLGLLLSTMTFSFPWLLWLGFMPANFYTFDYVPLLPWFGVVLIGLFLGGRFIFGRKATSSPNLAKPLNWLGRHSLLIYLLHQPILVGLLFAF